MSLTAHSCCALGIRATKPGTCLLQVRGKDNPDFTFCQTLFTMCAIYLPPCSGVNLDECIFVAKLTICKTCKKEVSEAAPTCPHCGEKHPGVNVNMGKGCLLLVIGMVLFMGLVAWIDEGGKTYATLDHVIEVNATDASISDKPAVSLMLGGDENHIVEVWLPKTGFSKNGYEDSTLSESKIMAGGWGKNTLFDTPNIRRSKIVKITSIDYTAKTAVLSLAFDLAEEDQHLVLEKTDIPISGQQFEAIFPSRK